MMEYLKKYKIAIISIVSLIIMLLGVLFWNSIIIKQNEKKELAPVTEPIDISDVNNVTNVEEKLGLPMKITQNYLIKYTTNKNGIWYMSKAKISKISYKNEVATITLVSEDGKKTLIGTINKDKMSVKKDDIVNFVGTVDFSTKGINLSKISKDDIKYKDVTEIKFDELVNNIEAVLNNQFVISGYMVTDGNKYKLFESKNAYNNNNKVGTYFTLSWKDNFNFTGNAEVTVQCYIEDTYKLKNCEMLK